MKANKQSSLQEMIDQLNLGDRLRLLGHRMDMVDLYHAMDLFVLSSFREGLPNVVLEAMAMRVPVVATRVADVPGVISDGQTGLLCPIGDVQAMTDQMRKVINDASLRGQLADNARQHIVQNFTFSQRMQRIRAVYDRLMQSTDRAAAPVAG